MQTRSATMSHPFYKLAEHGKRKADPVTLEDSAGLAESREEDEQASYQGKHASNSHKFNAVVSLRAPVR